MRKESLNRDIVIRTLVGALEPLDFVHACYEGGAAAFRRIDQWSDIDMYLVVDDHKVDETFRIVEDALKSLSTIKQKYQPERLPWPDVWQAFYKLEDAPEFLLIDLVILKLTSPEMFLEPEMHGDVVFYFNKSDRVNRPQLDRDALAMKLRKRLQRLRARFDVFNVFVQKEINRGNYLEAIDLYHTFTISNLVEGLRIKYNPVHHEFRMHYLRYELPSDIAKRLEQLCFVRNEKDLQVKYHEATQWFLELMSEMDLTGIEVSVKES